MAKNFNIATATAINTISDFHKAYIAIENAKKSYNNKKTELETKKDEILEKRATAIAGGMSTADASTATWYRASYNSEEGTIHITTPAGKAVLNESTSELEFINFPNDYTAYGGPMPS